MRQIIKLPIEFKIGDELEEKQKNINNGSTQPKWKLTSNQREEIVDKLLQSQKHLCCYCECKIDAANYHIEHFYERSDKKEFIYDYPNNLLLSCEGDRQKISAPETDEVKKERKANISCGHKKGETYHNNISVDYDLLLNPMNDNSALLFYNAKGEIEPRSEHQSEIEKVVYTKKRLNLNSDKLKNKRIDQIEDINNDILRLDLPEQQKLVKSLLDESRNQFPAYYSTIKDKFEFILVSQ